MKIKMLLLIVPSFSVFHFSFCHSYIIHMDIFSVKGFSATTGVRILKFGTKLESDELYCVTKQPHIACQSPFSFIFLSFHENFCNRFTAPIGVSVFKICAHLQVGKVYCVNENSDDNPHLPSFYKCSSFSYLSLL